MKIEQKRTRQCPAKVHRKLKILTVECMWPSRCAKLYRFKMASGYPGIGPLTLTLKIRIFYLRIGGVGGWFLGNTNVLRTENNTQYLRTAPEGTVPNFEKIETKASVRTDVRHMTCCQTLLMARPPSLFISCRLARSRLMCKDSLIFLAPLLIINHMRFVPGDCVAGLQHMLCYRRTLQIVLLDVPLMFSQSLLKITQRFSKVDCVAFLARYPVNDPLPWLLRDRTLQSGTQGPFPWRSTMGDSNTEWSQSFPDGFTHSTDVWNRHPCRHSGYFMMACHWPRVWTHPLVGHGPSVWRCLVVGHGPRVWRSLLVGHGPRVWRCLLVSVKLMNRDGGLAISRAWRFLA